MGARLTDVSVHELVERLATRDPIPGGGSAAALAGAIAAALVQMVVELTAGRASGEDEATLTEIRSGAASHQSDLLRLVEVDAAAYRSVLDARRLPRGTDRERESRRVQVEAATREATRAPMTTAERAAGVLEIAERLVPIGNPHAVSDVGAAAEIAAAAVRAALLNIEINVPHLPADDELVPEARAVVARLRGGLEERLASVRRAVADSLA